MQEIWTKAKPDRFHDAPHLRIDYSQATDEAKGFVLDATNAGEPRRYLYESKFRQGSWSHKITTADPSNKNSFSDRDGASKPMRAISGMPRRFRKDVTTDLDAKLTRFRGGVLAQEARYRELALQGQLIEGAIEAPRYYLNGSILIRIHYTIVREYVLAVVLPDGRIETALQYLR
jgi:hypothetical protein